jgi:hypothetical protein
MTEWAYSVLSDHLTPRIRLVADAGRFSLLKVPRSPEPGHENHPLHRILAERWGWVVMTTKDRNERCYLH